MCKLIIINNNLLKYHLIVLTIASFCHSYYQLLYFCNENYNYFLLF